MEIYSDRNKGLVNVTVDAADDALKNKSVC